MSVAIRIIGKGLGYALKFLMQHPEIANEVITAVQAHRAANERS